MCKISHFLFLYFVIFIKIVVPLHRKYSNYHELIINLKFKKLCLM